jgi:hypothetical protein
MRKYICSPDGDEVDLDDPKTYHHITNDINELRKLMFSEIGYAYCYMNFWHKDIFGVRDGGQKIRVELLIKNFTSLYHKKYDDVIWYKEQLFLLRDEIENMC